ncbi:MAG TPA: hypothetical protein DCS07_07230 [Bdellovibrionales bacterium]|nr:MAG: hypothetical protein A2X97_00785 [Bdellovibrionales bacterium GWA1_52_35]OFZ34933.1 MAG: hypothetical protein A2070_14435 [Bdellovibrionales bacterium GWC1_52_8]HAR42411.1 hypothetical protein [Bdellovibrionales bacterium]HCM40664.1 hypothetical protein [Bdellovibrionales bacterium]
MFKFVFLVLCIFFASELRAAEYSEQLPLVLESGRRITAQLKIPSGVKTQSALQHPVLLVFGGFQHAAEVLELLYPQKSYILASFDYPFDPPRRFEFPGSLRLAGQAKRMVHDTLDGIDRLVRELRKRPDVDPDRISIVGASLGAPFAALSVGRSPEIAGLVLIHGFGDIPGVITHQLMRVWGPRYGRWTYPLAWALGQSAWKYLQLESPEQAVRNLRAHQKSLIVAAEQDSFIPSNATQSLRQAFKNQGAYREIFMPGDHLQPGAGELIHSIMQLTQKWLEEVDLGPQLATLPQ